LSVWGVSVIGVIAGHLEAARFWLEMISYGVAILAGGYNLYMIFKKRLDDKVERAAKEHQAALAVLGAKVDAQTELLRKQEELLVRHRRKH
jgi:ABC-type nickel/cobalt efflux system permease component RcnA